ncbi:hypothetical protein C5S32_03145 [ANME-1 cluster archaeon GoMg1]|nr:hypothetical protein [ANME-1 cluster archaeon GoMg1]
MGCGSVDKGKGGSGKNVKSYLLLGLMLLVVVSINAASANLNPTLLSETDLVVKSENITFMVIHPENASSVGITNAASNAIYDTDTVMINATIANQGILPAENFTTHIFFEYGSLESFSRERDSMGYCGKKLPEECWQWENRSYAGAECIFVYIDEQLKSIKDNLIIYDGNNNETARPDNKAYWIPVLGDTVKIHYNDVYGVGFNIYFYAGNITKIWNLSLEPNELTNVSMIQSVSNGNHQIRVFVDLENNVTEHDEGNNIASKTIHVHPSRDFTADMQLFHNGAEISANDTVWDGDTVMINATIGMGINESDPYNKSRKGIVEVEIINEHEWVNVSPRHELTDHGYAQVITYPGADAIRVHFAELSLPGNGFVEIKDKEGNTCWSKHNFEGSNISSDWIKGDIVYVCKEKGPYDEPVGGRITFSIDKYQYKKPNYTAVLLNASETKSILLEWNVSAGNHTMRAIADPEGKIGEINESNNVMNKTLQVKANRDPAVINITFEPEGPAMGSDVTINALIANKGNKTANFSVDLWAVKTEYHPYDSLHDADFPCWRCEKTECRWTSSPEWVINSTYPEADWMGVHFTRINTTTPPDTEWRSLYVDDENGNRIEYFNNFDEEDIWVWAKGNKIKLETPKGSSPVWGFSIDNHEYKIILNRTALTLGTNETANVTGILRNIRAGNRSLNYTIHASVDMGDVLYETNESNNEMIRILDIHVPDLTVSEIECEGGEIIAKVENIGFGTAENVTVRFMRDVKYPMERWGSGVGSISCKDADVMRVHVEYLYVDEGEEDSYLQIGNERYEEDDKDGFWSPWISSDSIALIWNNAHFKIDRHEYGVDENIGDLEANRPVDKPIPEEWDEYKAPYNLTVWIDPLDVILEGNEGNNDKTVLVYVDLIPETEFVSPDIRHLSMDVGEFVIDAIVRNDNTLKDGVTLPASAFDVTLEVRRPDGTIASTQTLPANVNRLYGGKEVTITFANKSIFPTSENIEQYNVSVIADSTNKITELDEDNNIISVNVTVYPWSGYASGSELINIAKGEVRGRVVYEVNTTTYKIPYDEDYIVYNASVMSSL